MKTTNASRAACPTRHHGSAAARSTRRSPPAAGTAVGWSAPRRARWLTVDRHDSLRPTGPARRRRGDDRRRQPQLGVDGGVRAARGHDIDLDARGVDETSPRSAVAASPSVATGSRTFQRMPCALEPRRLSPSAESSRRVGLESERSETWTKPMPSRARDDASRESAPRPRRARRRPRPGGRRRRRAAGRGRAAAHPAPGRRGRSRRPRATGAAAGVGWPVARTPARPPRPGGWPGRR